MPKAAHQLVGLYDGKVGRQHLRAPCTHDLTHADRRTTVLFDKVNQSIAQALQRSPTQVCG